MRPVVWTPADVAERLKEIGLGKFSDDFKMSNITGIDIYYITDDDLRNIGMTVVQRATYVSWLESLPPNRSKFDTSKRKKLLHHQKKETKEWTHRASTSENRRNVNIKSKKVDTSKTNSKKLPLPTIIYSDIPDDDEFSRIQCVYCGRKFVKDRIQQHEKICSETHAKQRSVFNSQKQRLCGSEAINYLKHSKNVVRKKTNFRAEHTKLIQSLRSARGKKLLNENDWDYCDEYREASERIQCPHCSRKFGIECAYKHINSCTANMNLKRPMHL